MKTVLLVEDEPEARRHLADAVRAHPELELVAEEGTVAQGAARLRELRPNALLTDLGLPDGSGLELIRQAAVSGSTLPLVVTVFGDEAHVIEAIRAGAMGYMLKSESHEKIARAVLTVLDGGSPLSALVARGILGELRGPSQTNGEPSETGGLSTRELEVLRYIVKGFTYAEIAELLGLSPTTVATHVRRVYRKLSVHSRSEATYEALQLGIIRPED